MKQPPPKRFTKSEKLQIVHDVRTYQQRHGCSQKNAILALGYKVETVHHWILQYNRGELLDRGAESAALANALAWYDKGEDLPIAARRGGVSQNVLITALKRRPPQPRHRHYS